AECCKLWNSHADSLLSQAELAAALKELFSAPPSGGGFGIRTTRGAPGSPSPQIVRGAATAGSSEELPTPDSQLAKHIFAGADANKDGFLSLQEVNDFLDKSFGQWDQNSNGSLDEREFALAFGQLALPDGAVTAPVLSQ